MRVKFEKELNKLNNELIEMGTLIEESIKLATEALLNRDITLAKKAMDFEKKIDIKEREIETLCLKIFVEQQPVASDFRTVSAILKMITDMERIGDHAEDISEITIHFSKNTNIDNIVLVNIKKMANDTIKMVKESIDAFVDKDLELAYNVVKYDDIVDNLFYTIKDELIEFIIKDKTNASDAIDLLMISKYFERIGDHAVNIAEWVIFTITGEHESID